MNNKHKHNRDLLFKLGLNVIEVNEVKRPMHIREMSSETFEDPTIKVTQLKVEIDDERFYSMCHLIRFTDMICESKNPAVEEMYGQLLTMLELTKKT